MTDYEIKEGLRWMMTRVVDEWPVFHEHTFTPVYDHDLLKFMVHISTNKNVDERIGYVLLLNAEHVKRRDEVYLQGSVRKASREWQKALNA